MIMKSLADNKTTPQTQTPQTYQMPELRTPRAGTPPSQLLPSNSILDSPTENPVSATLSKILANWYLPSFHTSIIPPSIDQHSNPDLWPLALTQALYELSQLTVGNMTRAHNLLVTYCLDRSRGTSEAAVLDVEDVERAIGSLRIIIEGQRVERAGGIREKSQKLELGVAITELQSSLPDVISKGDHAIGTRRKVNGTTTEDTDDKETDTEIRPEKAIKKTSENDVSESTGTMVTTSSSQEDEAEAATWPFGRVSEPVEQLNMLPQGVVHPPPGSSSRRSPFSPHSAVIYVNEPVMDLAESALVPFSEPLTSQLQAPTLSSESPTLSISEYQQHLHPPLGNPYATPPRQHPRSPLKHSYSDSTHFLPQSQTQNQPFGYSPGTNHPNSRTAQVQKPARVYHDIFSIPPSPSNTPPATINPAHLSLISTTTLSQPYDQFQQLSFADQQPQPWSYLQREAQYFPQNQYSQQRVAPRKKTKRRE